MWERATIAIFILMSIIGIIYFVMLMVSNHKAIVEQEEFIRRNSEIYKKNLPKIEKTIEEDDEWDK